MLSFEGALPCCYIIITAFHGPLSFPLTPFPTCSSPLCSSLPNLSSTLYYLAPPNFPSMPPSPFLLSPLLPPPPHPPSTPPPHLPPPSPFIPFFLCLPIPSNASFPSITLPPPTTTPLPSLLYQATRADTKTAVAPLTLGANSSNT